MGKKGPRPQWVKDKISLMTKKAMRDPKVLEKIKGVNNSQWRGNNAGLNSIHRWVVARKPKPKLCVDCKKNNAIDLANISQEYLRDVNDFKWICRKCHMNEDGRINNLKQYSGKGFKK